MKLARTFGVWAQLQSHPDGLTLKQLAEKFGVSKNTIQRDIDQLSQAGVPVGERQHGTAIRYRLESHTGSLDFGVADLKALQAARAAMHPFKRSAMFKAFETAVSKLEAQYRPNALEAFEGPLWTGARETPSSTMQTLLTAVLECRRCRIQYRPRGKAEPREYVIEPHAFLLWNGVTYLRACVPPYENLVPFVAYQISEAALLEETFTRKNTARTGFGVFQGHSTEDVEVHFHAEVAPYIREKRWHPTQQLEERPDGGVTFRATLSGEAEFVGWVMSWGPSAELVKPEAWREELVRRTEGLLKLHETE